MKSCPFCELRAGQDDPPLRVLDTNRIVGLVSLKQKPGNHGHVLVLPKAHVETIHDLPDNLAEPLMTAVRLMSRAVRHAFSADGIQIRQNNGAAAGQDVPHLHFHIIPRFHGDGFDTAAYESLSLTERLALATRLRAAVGVGPRD